MKKITLFLAAMAAAGAANALVSNNPIDPETSLTFVKYNTVSGEFTETYPAIDETFTWAVSFDMGDATTSTWLNGSEGDVINTAAFHIWNDDNVSGKTLDARLQKISDGVYGVDINFAQVKIDGEAYVLPSNLESDGTYHQYALVTEAQVGGSQWWSNLTAQIDQGYTAATGVGTTIPASTFGETYVGNWEAGVAAPGSVAAGVADVYADENNTEIAGYYTLLGAQLSEEPANGVFIVKFTNGKAIKVVK